MKKKIIGSVLVLGIVAAAAGLFVPNAVQKITKESVITSSQLEKAVDISELSTAEFIYNGIADKYSDGNLEETECHIAYASTVKVGIALDQITFTIDEEKKTVTPVLPEITVNTVTVDPDSLPKICVIFFQQCLIFSIVVRCYPIFFFENTNKITDIMVSHFLSNLTDLILVFQNHLFCFF